ncbi:MAG: radical SAM protein, partial [Pseudonocardiaceae bacterium]
MTPVPVAAPSVRRSADRPHSRRDAYGHARLPASAHAPAPERVDKIPYGRFRNVYLYITEACQLRCEHCYMGERLERALKMPFDQISQTLTTWRKMGGSKLTILGGEPTLHPDYMCVSTRPRPGLSTSCTTTLTPAGSPCSSRSPAGTANQRTANRT